ncbi:MAG: hypothetical protein V3V78_00935 [Candidatus Woesearchaeota archaeon]
MKDLDKLIEAGGWLSFVETSGDIDLDWLPHKVHFDFNSDIDSIIKEDIPAAFKITPDTGGGRSISVWLWKEIPEEYKPVLFFHELTEAMYSFVHGYSKRKSHDLAIIAHMAYAKKYLYEEEFTDFCAWQEQFEEYKA